MTVLLYLKKRKEKSLFIQDVGIPRSQNIQTQRSKKILSCRRSEINCSERKKTVSQNNSGDDLFKIVDNDLVYGQSYAFIRQVIPFYEPECFCFPGLFINF